MNACNSILPFNDVKYGCTAFVDWNLTGNGLSYCSASNTFHHFYASLQAPNGQWHEMNDSTVTMVSPQHILKQQAYILFYSKVQAPSPNGSSARHSETAITMEGRGHSNGLRTSYSSSDDLGEAVSADERALLQVRAASKLLPTARSSSSIEESECDSTQKGEQEMEDVDMSMRYVDRETRLKRKYSWAVKPFRSVPTGALLR
jgi:hypothetical protein